MDTQRIEQLVNHLPDKLGNHYKAMEYLCCIVTQSTEIDYDPKEKEVMLDFVDSIKEALDGNPIKEARPIIERYIKANWEFVDTERHGDELDYLWPNKVPEIQDKFDADYVKLITVQCKTIKSGEPELIQVAIDDILKAAIAGQTKKVFVKEEVVGNELIQLLKAKEFRVESKSRKGNKLEITCEW